MSETSWSHHIVTTWSPRFLHQKSLLLSKQTQGVPFCCHQSHWKGTSMLQSSPAAPSGPLGRTSILPILSFLQQPLQPPHGSEGTLNYHLEPVHSAFLFSTAQGKAVQTCLLSRIWTQEDEGWSQFLCLEEGVIKTYRMEKSVTTATFQRAAQASGVKAGGRDD